MVFATSSSRILTWWYPDLKSILENIFSFLRWSNKSSLQGIGYLFLIVNLLSCRYSMHILMVPSFFFTKRIRASQGDTLGLMYPFSANSCGWVLNSTNYGSLIRYGILDTGTAPRTKFINKSRSLLSGSPSIFSENTSLNLDNTRISSILYCTSSLQWWKLTAYSLQPFLALLLSCKELYMSHIIISRYTLY